MTTLTTTLSERRLEHALDPWAQMHENWRAHAAAKLNLPPAWAHGQGRVLARRLASLFQLRGRLLDVADAPMRSLLLRSDEAQAFVLRLGLLIWQPALSKAIDGRARRALNERLGTDGAALIAEALERTPELSKARARARLWQDETALTKSGCALWCAALGLKASAPEMQRLWLALPSSWHTQDLRATTALAPATFLWFLQESFPSCSWLKP